MVFEIKDPACGFNAQGAHFIKIDPLPTRFVQHLLLKHETPLSTLH